MTANQVAGRRAYCAPPTRRTSKPDALRRSSASDDRRRSATRLQQPALLGLLFASRSRSRDRTTTDPRATPGPQESSPSRRHSEQVRSRRLAGKDPAGRSRRHRATARRATTVRYCPAAHLRARCQPDACPDRRCNRSSASATLPTCALPRRDRSARHALPRSRALATWHRRTATRDR